MSVSLGTHLVQELLFLRVWFSLLLGVLRLVQLLELLHRPEEDDDDGDIVRGAVVLGLLGQTLAHQVKVICKGKEGTYSTL